MTLKEWLAEKGRGALQRLHYETRISLPTLHKAKRGERISIELALRVEKATDGAVPASLLGRAA